MEKNKPKRFTNEFKAKVINEYLDGQGGRRFLAKKYGIRPSTIKYWLDTSDIDIKIAKLNGELEKLTKDIETLVKENTGTVKDQEIWKKKYAALENSYKNKVSSLDNLTLKKKEKALKRNRVDAFIELIRKGEILTEFDERIFNFVLDRAIVPKDKSITFIFLSGHEITIND